MTVAGSDRISPKAPIHWWLAGAAGAYAWILLPAGGGFRPTFALAPLCGALLAQLARSGIGPRALLPTLVSVVGATAHALLRVAGLQPLLLAGLYAAVALATLAALPGIWRRFGAARGPARGLVPVAIVIAFAIYLTFLPWQTSRRAPDGDEPWFLLLAHSIATDLDTDLADEYAAGEAAELGLRAKAPQPGDPVGPRGERYSRHSAFLPLLLAAPLRAGGVAGALVAMALLTATLSAAILRLLLLAAPRRRSSTLLTWALLMLTAPLVVYSYQVWTEVPAALLVALAAAALVRGSGSRTDLRSDLVLLGCAVLALPLLKLRFGVVAAGLLAATWLVRRDLRRWLTPAAVAGVLVGVGLLAVNRALFGRALRIYQWRDLAGDVESLRTPLERALGLLLDPAYGWAAAAPLALLVLPGSLLVLRRHRRLALALAVAALPYLGLIVLRREWYGGWAPPLRYPLAILPLAALPLDAALRRRDRSGPRLLAGVLGASSLLLAAFWIAFPGWTYSFADGRSRLADALSVRLGADLSPWLPSAARPGPALWWAAIAVGVLVLAPFFSSRLATPGRRRGTAAATALALLALTLLPLAAVSLPTRIVQPESPVVEKTGGAADPERWIVDRTRFPEGWLLRQGEELRTEVIPGGDAATIELHLRAILNAPGGIALRIALGDAPVATLELARHEVWQVREVELDRWTGSGPAELVVAIAPPGPSNPPGILNGVVIDHITFRWR